MKEKWEGCAARDASRRRGAGAAKGRRATTLAEDGRAHLGREFRLLHSHGEVVESPEVHRARGTVVDATQLVRERRLGHRERHLARRAARAEASGRLGGRHGSSADARARIQPSRRGSGALTSPGGRRDVRRAALLAASWLMSSAGRRCAWSAKMKNCWRSRARAIPTPKPFTRSAGRAADTTARARQPSRRPTRLKPRRTNASRF